MLIAAATAALVPGLAQAQATKWGTVIQSADGSRLQGCRERADGMWRLRVRADNRRVGRRAIARVKVIRNYWSGNKPNRVVSSWSRKVPRGKIRRGSVHARIVDEDLLGDNDAVRVHLRRGNGTGTLTWVLSPRQLPRCGMRPTRRHWGAASVQTCTALVGGGYGPVWRIWGRGDNRKGTGRRRFEMAVWRGPEQQVIASWSVLLPAGKVSKVRVVHASLLTGDKVGTGFGDPGGGGGGGELDPRLDNIC